jgi:hypothetical protein
MATKRLRVDWYRLCDGQVKAKDLNREVREDKAAKFAEKIKI